MKKYRLLEHTADLGIEVFGYDLRELFINSATAMYELIADIGSVKPEVSIDIKIEAQDKESLLKGWLSELLYYFNVKDMLLCEFSIKKISDKNIVSAAEGEKIDTKRHTLKHEIKAVTFHNLKIEKKENMLSTQIIFDV